MERFTNPYVQCPYNAAHQVPRLRLQHHIIRCRKNVEHIDERTCPFNATHIMSSKKFPNHLLKCPDRKRVEGHKCLDDEKDTGNFGNPSFYDDVTFSYSWEEDGDNDNNILEERTSNLNEHFRQHTDDRMQTTGPYVNRNSEEPSALEPIPYHYLGNEHPGHSRNIGALSKNSSEIKEDISSNAKEQTLPTQETETLKKDFKGLGRGRVYKVLMDLKKV